MLVLAKEQKIFTKQMTELFTLYSVKKNKKKHNLCKMQMWSLLWTTNIPKFRFFFFLTRKLVAIGVNPLPFFFYIVAQHNFVIISDTVLAEPPRMSPILH